MEMRFLAGLLQQGCRFLVSCTVVITGLLLNLLQKQQACPSVFGEDATTEWLMMSPAEPV